MPPTVEPKRQVRGHQPYQRKPKAPKAAEGPKTSAKPPIVDGGAHSNLTLFDWLNVVEYHDTHQPLSQFDTVEHFASRQEGALIFTQSTLSRHLSKRGRAEDNARAASNPTALSGKRARVVTRPDVERALVLWVRHMEKKRETVTGPILVAKRSKFEKAMNVPEAERLDSGGWVQKFCSTYGMKEYRRHGEAGSVDVAAAIAERERCSKILSESAPKDPWNPVAAAIAERERCSKILSKFAPKDQWNLDEGALFEAAPPDRGLATKKMAGKKGSKTRITVTFACNADGSEKLPIFFIGKYAKPRACGEKSLAQRGFYYRNNETAWMTAKLYEEWIKQQDLRFRNQNRHICLFVDNFKGHKIIYKPTNIQLEFFKPNLTSYVQPLDAGIICTFKGHYRRAFYNRAVERDEAGDENIYKINQLDIMLLAREAWDAVKPETIQNCWRHSGILGPDSSDIREQSEATAAASAPVAPPLPPIQDPHAWAIVQSYALGDQPLPEAEKELTAYLGDQYCCADWEPAFNAILTAQDDTAAAIWRR